MTSVMANPGSSPNSRRNLTISFVVATVASFVSGVAVAALVARLDLSRTHLRVEAVKVQPDPKKDYVTTIQVTVVNNSEHLARDCHPVVEMTSEGGRRLNLSDELKQIQAGNRESFSAALVTPEQRKSSGLFLVECANGGSGKFEQTIEFLPRDPGVVITEVRVDPYGADPSSITVHLVAHNKLSTALENCKAVATAPTEGGWRIDFPTAYQLPPNSDTTYTATIAPNGVARLEMRFFVQCQDDRSVDTSRALLLR